MLPLIENNMQFDVILRAIETVLKAESVNQINLNGIGWNTVRERFDPWNIETNEMNPGIANVVYSASNFDDSESNQFEQTALTNFSVDCYAASKAKEEGWGISPKDQEASDVLHALITKIYYTLMSSKNIDLGLTPGTIVLPFVTSIIKFIPTESNIPIQGVTAARMAYRIKHIEIPPEASGVDLEEVNVKTNREDDVNYLDQTFDVK